MADGFSSESLLDEVALTVYNYVVNDLGVSPSRVVLIGRSVGSGPAVKLASTLDSKGTPVAALVLQSPYTSIRAVADDLLGCVSLCFLDRWESWRSLAHSKSSSSSASSCSCCCCSGAMFSPSLSFGVGVIKSPVLFVHADNDEIIFHAHSLHLHSLRLKDNLPTAIFTQVSTEGFTKNHNQFDFDSDYIIPTRDFLHKHVPYSPEVGRKLRYHQINYRFFFSFF